jgi:hypothetical protein
MKKVKCVFVFCEGPHDVAFVSKVLKVNKKFKDIGDRNIAELPYPISKHYIAKNQVYEPLTDVQRVSDPFMPKSVIWDDKKQTYFILYAVGGVSELISWKKESSVVKEIELIKLSILDGLKGLRDIEDGVLDKLDFTYNKRNINPQEAIAYDPVFAFVMDADEGTASERYQEFKTNYETIFGANSFDVLEENSWNANQNLGLFIFSDATSKRGSLEDLVESVVKEKTTYQQMQTHYDTRIPVKSPGDTKQISATSIKRKKASLCATGQDFYPGSSLAVIVADENNRVLDEQLINNDPQCQALADFFNQVVLP